MPNHVNPSRESFQAFRDLKREGPIQMLNLIKLKAHARYEDGTQSTGAEAYRMYGKLAGPIFQTLGGRIIWSGTPETTLIGPTGEEDWDIAFIAQYPDMNAFISMVRDPAYQAITHHRTAAVENSRLVRMQSNGSVEGFSG